MADRAVEFKAKLGVLAAWPGRILFPPTCLACASHVAAPGSLCPACWREAVFLERPWCAVLGIPFTHEMGEGAVSPAAIADPPPYARARAALSYRGVARRLVQGLKYRDRTDLAPWMAVWMARAGAELLADADLIVPVPLHRRRFFLRRFNQSAELARALSARCGVAFHGDLVTRIRGTKQQVGLKARERAENVRGAFSVTEKGAALLRGRNVVLVDDVITTGATVAAVTKALLRGGVAQVDVLAFARALPGDFRQDEQDPI